MRRNWNHKALLYTAAFLCCAGALVPLGYLANSVGQPRVRGTTTVQRETLPVTVTEVGQLEPKEYEIVAAPIRGVLVWLIKEGTYVRPGDVVGRMNDDDAREELETQQIIIKNRDAMLRKAELDLQETTKDLEYERQKAQLELDQAELVLKELETKPAAPVAALATINQSYWRVASDVAMKLAELDVEYGRLAEATSLKKYERQKALQAKGVASENDVADARLKYEKDRTVHENARIVLELLQKGTPESEIETAREKVKQARVKLAQIQQSAKVQLELKKTAIAVAQAELDRIKETVEIDKKIVESTVARAQTEGTALHWGQWERPHEGDYLWDGNGFVSVTQMGKMLALTRVNEVDSRRIGVGQKALIRLEAIPGKVYHGKVVRMASLATDRDERFQGILKKDLSGVMVFDVTVEIEERDTAMRPTMSATVEIITEELRGMITIPFSALIERDGKKFVRVKENGRIVEREISVGIAYKSKIVVTKGLKERDEVCRM